MVSIATRVIRCPGKVGGCAHKGMVIMTHLYYFILVTVAQASVIHFRLFSWCSYDMTHKSIHCQSRQKALMEQG